MAPDAPVPTTPPQLRSAAPSAPAPTRQSNRMRTMSARARAAADVEMETTRESAESQPDIYITLISSVLGPVARKLEALDGHIEGLTNNVGTYDIRVNALEGQVTSLLTIVQNSEALIRALLEASKQSETTTANLEAKIAELGTQNSTLLEVVKQNETRTANLETKIANLETQIAKLETQNSTLLEAVQKSTQTQSSNFQVLPNATMSYADIARQPSSSQPSNLWTPSSPNTTPPTTIDTLYCTVDTSRVGEDDKGKAQPGAIRQAIEEEIRTAGGHANWRCVAVTRTPGIRNASG